MAVGAFLLLVAALGYQFGGFGRSEFLPKSDYGTLAIEVRTPSSTSLEYARSKVEKAAELARTDARDQEHRRRVNATGGRVWVDVGDKGDRSRSLQRARGRPARQAQAARRRRIRGARRSRQGRAQAGADPVLRRRTRASSWRSPTSSWTRCGRFRAPWTWACPSRIRRTSCASSSIAVSRTSSASP